MKKAAAIIAVITLTTTIVWLPTKNNNDTVAESQAFIETYYDNCCISTTQKNHSTYHALLSGQKLHKEAELLFCKSPTETDTSPLIFPLKVTLNIRENNPMRVSEQEIIAGVKIINDALQPVGIQLALKQIDTIFTPTTLPYLLEDPLGLGSFKAEYENPEMVNIFLLDDSDKPFTIVNNRKIYTKKHGFADPISEWNRSVFFNKSSLSHLKVLPHELGHFFGLLHTFEEGGDGIDDTPVDPNEPFYVNSSEDRMEGLFDEEGNPYNPIISNYMNYYRPSYMKEYSFTQGQMDQMYETARRAWDNNLLSKEEEYVVVKP